MITVERVGRRSYFIGNTYPIKDKLRAAGAHWDGDKRAWWIGDHAKAEALAGAGSSAAPEAGERNSDALSDDAKIAGKARYKGREYLLVWEGETKRGYAAKLSFADGSKIFWANDGEFQVTKTYSEGMTFGALKRFREDFKRQRDEEKALGAKNGLVGERGDVSSQFEGSKTDRKPSYEVGDTRWLKVRGERKAMTVIGYELAGYVSEDDWEDMGHYGKRSGWYGSIYYREATADEAVALQAREP